MNIESDALRGKRILLVEDERVVREALRQLFTQDSHTVVEANNGAEAFSLFHRQKFDLVVTDFEMPFIKGDELATRIKQVAPNQPILMITAFSHRPSMDNPVDAVVHKPFDSGRLRAIMERLLSQPGEEPSSASCGSAAQNA
jgi:DNA-binding response OmpR family regulator